MSELKTLAARGCGKCFAQDCEWPECSPRAKELKAFAEIAPNDGWLQDGSLLYRLTDEKNPQNRDEINVTMADGMRSIEARTRRASELLDRIRANRKEPQ